MVELRKGCVIYSDLLILEFSVSKICADSLMVLSSKNVVDRAACEEILMLSSCLIICK